MNHDVEPLSGVIVPMLTPLDEQGEPDIAALRRLMRRLIAGGVNGLFIGGTAGLGPLLCDDHWRMVMETAVDEAGRGANVPLLAGVMETSTPRAILRIRHLESIGYRLFVLTPTFYVRTQQPDEFRRHFQECREATSMRLVAYNIPGCAGSSIPEDLIVRMMEDGWLAGVKDSSGDDALLERICAVGRPCGVPVFQGNRPDLQRLREIGASGMVPVPSNVDTAPFVEGWAAVRCGDVSAMRTAAQRIDLLWEILVGQANDWIAGTTYAIGRLGLGCGRSITPLNAASVEQRNTIDKLELFNP